MTIERILANRLTSRGIVLEPTHNSIFTAMRDYGEDSLLVRQATLGMTKLVKADINLFRNTILPLAKDLENEVRNRSKLTPTTIVDEVNIHTLSRREGIDMLETIGVANSAATATYTMLPANSLVVTYDKVLVSESLTFKNSRITRYVNELLAEHPEDYVEKLHDAIFGGLSADNERLIAITRDPVGRYSDALIGLLITEGYNTKTLGVSNLKPTDARNKYLYRLRDIFITILNRYTAIYDGYLRADILIANIVVGAGAKRDVYLVGETYTKYLEEHSVGAIIGIASATRTPADRISMSDIVDAYDTHTGYYNNSLRMATLKSAGDSIITTRLLYKLVTGEYLRDLPESKLSNLGMQVSDIPEVMTAVEDYINKLSAVAVMDITSVCRRLAGVYVHNDYEFMAFVDSMGYYHKLYPKLGVDEIAATAMIAHTMSKLTVQLLDTVRE